MTGAANREGNGKPDELTVSATLRCWNTAAGNLLFRWRNALFPGVFVLAAFTVRPEVILGSATINSFLLGFGVAVALVGEGFRLLTIGFEYIHRGGKDRRPYASRLIKEGIYASTRNPMYVGNALIAVGMTLATTSPMAYLVLIPLFLFVYQAIVSAEEEYLLKKFGSEHEAYCASVNRFLPSFSVIHRLWSRAHWDWKRAVRKDLSTLMGLITGLTLLPVWRTYFLQGSVAAELQAVRALVMMFAFGALYAVLLYLKKRKRLFS